MEKKNQISEMIQESMAKVREMADTNTIVGQPIHTPDGVTLIPISRVSFGFGGGGGAAAGGDAGADHRAGQFPGLGCEPSGGTHLFDLGGGFDGDHVHITPTPLQ